MAAVALLGAIAAPLRAADLPALTKADLGMRQGQRLSYIQASATVGASGLNLIPDANGNWVVATTGRVLQEGAGTGGLGLSLFDVYEFGSQTNIKRTDFLFNTVINAFVPSGSGILIGNTSTVDILWAKPANFAAYPNQNKTNFRVSRLTYTLDGRKFNAIRIQQNLGSGWTQSTYDLATGLLLIESYAVSNSSGTSLAFLRLTSGKRLTLPGMVTTWPTALKATKSYNWALTNVDTVSGAGSITSHATVAYSGITWTSPLVKFSVVINGSTAGKLQQHAGEIGAVWMSPTVLKALKVNAVLDAESAIAYKVVVVSNTGGKAVIAVRTKTTFANYQYNTSTGDLLSVVSRNLDGLHTKDQTLVLTSRK